MRDGQRPVMNSQQRRASFSGAPKNSNVARIVLKGDQNARKNYERYSSMARAEILAGNTVEAENYYQHAEHYWRSMAPHQ
jgi:hypothetical protein